jgi:heavy metal sensor kinase
MNTRSIRFRLTAWYAGLLGVLLVLFTLATYVVLERYLTKTLKDSLSKQARDLGDTLLVNVNQSGEQYVIDEIKEHYAPETNDLFLRVTRGDGSVLYISGTPRSKNFDPAKIATPIRTVTQESSREVELDKDFALLVETLPFVAHDGNRFLIEIGAPYREIEDVSQGLLLALGVALPFAIALAVGGGYLLMRRALKPVDEIRRSAERITSQNLSERLPVVRTGDELERLSTSLNQMIMRLEKAFQQSNRFSADASHELRTPLSILRGELETLARKPDTPSDIRETIGSALEETERLTKITENLLALSRLDAETQLEQTRVDLGELVTTTTDQMKLLAEDKKISLRCNTSMHTEVKGSRARLKQVVVNLVDNAIKYTPEGGEVQVTVTKNDDQAILEVTDTGVGIPAESLPQIFERFYRADRARTRTLGGTGLGLSIVKSICKAHGGNVKAESIDGRGSRFRVELPLVNDDSR